MSRSRTLVSTCVCGRSASGQRYSDAGGQIDLQIKSTTRAHVRRDAVTYDLEIKNYDDLREGGDNCPRILVVLVLPEDESRWFFQSEDELTLRHCAYWLSLEGYPASTSTSTVRVTIPRANVFSPQALQDLLARLRQRKAP